MTFEEYYKNYLELHKNKWNRRLHVIGQVVTLMFVVSCIYNQVFFLLFASPFVVYPFAWSGHYFFEKNKPAAFKNPLWAKASDWVMLKDIIMGRISW